MKCFIVKKQLRIKFASVLSSWIILKKSKMPSFVFRLAIVCVLSAFFTIEIQAVNKMWKFREKKIVVVWISFLIFILCARVMYFLCNSNFGMMHHHKVVVFEVHGHDEMNQIHNWMCHLLMKLLTHLMHQEEIVLAQAEIVFQNVLQKKEIVGRLECPAQPDRKVCFYMGRPKYKSCEIHTFIRWIRKKWFSSIFRCDNVLWKVNRKKFKWFTHGFSHKFKNTRSHLAVNHT